MEQDINQVGGSEVVENPTVRCTDCRKIITLRNRTNEPQEKIYCPSCGSWLGRLCNWQ